MLIVSGSLSSACNTQSAQASDKPSAPTESGRKPAKPTPDVIAAGAKILAKNPDAKVGSEHPFVVDGKHYVGRIEEHDNPANEPGRPPGKHKGVTVYEK